MTDYKNKYIALLEKYNKLQEEYCELKDRSTAFIEQQSYPLPPVQTLPSFVCSNCRGVVRPGHICC